MFSLGIGTGVFVYIILQHTFYEINSVACNFVTGVGIIYALIKIVLHRICLFKLVL